MTDIAALITRLRELQEQATPLPWVNMDDDTFFGELRACSDDRFELVAVMPKNDDRTSDFEYMAAAANLAPALLDEVERLRYDIEDLKVENWKLKKGMRYIGAYRCFGCGEWYLKPVGSIAAGAPMCPECTAADEEE